jgi:hypothetical protein
MPRTARASAAGAVYHVLNCGNARMQVLSAQSDSHPLTVPRYVERSPLRADLVARAEDWPWSSARRLARPNRPARLQDGPVPFIEGRGDQVQPAAVPRETRSPSQKRHPRRSLRPRSLDQADGRETGTGIHSPPARKPQKGGEELECRLFSRTAGAEGTGAGTQEEDEEREISIVSPELLPARTSATFVHGVENQLILQ